MKIIICFSLLGVALASLGVNTGPNKIVGGTNAAPHAYPYQISLQSKRGDHFCGGSLVKATNGEIVVITAALCVDGELPANIQVKVGEYELFNADTSGFEKVYDVKKIRMHPSYNRNTQSNDVAIVYLKDPVTLNQGVQPIAITKLSAQTFVNKQCTITGWGSLTEGGQMPSILQVAAVDFYPKSVCKEEYGKKFIQETMICGGKLGGGIDTCQGDSGGPFVCTNESTGQRVLSGITSLRTGCAQPGKAGIYTDVYRMRSWLQNYIKV